MELREISTKAERIGELLDELTDWLAGITEENCDVTEGNRILAELDLLDSFEDSFDVQESLNRFHVKYRALFERAEALHAEESATPLKS